MDLGRRELLRRRQRPALRRRRKLHPEVARAVHSLLLRVLLLIPGIGLGGAETQAVHLAVGLAGRGDEVTLGVMEPLGLDPAPLIRAGVRVVDFDGADRLTKWRRVPQVARVARRADVVHCARWDAGLWGRLAALGARAPVTVAEHSSDRSMQNTSTGASRARMIAWHHRLLAPFTAATVACGRSQLALLEAEGVPRRRIALIPNGVPVAEIRQAATASSLTRRDIGVPDTARMVIQVSRLTPEKNQVATLEAVAALRREIGDVHAVFVGGGVDDSAREHAREAEWAHFLGPRTDVPELLALADVAVLPSIIEAFPMSALEAMAVGVPQVVSDAGDLGILMEESGAGLSVPAHDVTAFTDACRAVLTGDVGARLALRAREAAERWDVAPMVEKYAALFAAAVAHAPLPRASNPWRS